MKVDLNKALSREEVDAFRAVLDAARWSSNFEETEGYLTALATGPANVPPSSWMPKVLGGYIADSIEQSQAASGLLIRFWNQLLEGLNDSKPRFLSDLASAEQRRDFCRGYVRAFREDRIWCADVEAAAWVFPLANLSGEVDLASSKDHLGNRIENPGEQLEMYENGLLGFIQKSHDYWVQWRKRSMSEAAPARPEKTSRNAPCPCGSGKKFKQCCIDK